MKYTLELTRTAIADIEKHKIAGDKKILKKISKLLNELLEHPRTGTGKPEQLNYELAGFYSRRISKKHRMVYHIKDEIVTVIVLSAHSHYEDK